MKIRNLLFLFLISATPSFAQSIPQIMETIEEGFHLYVKEKTMMLGAKQQDCPIETVVKKEIITFKVYEGSIQKDKDVICIKGTWTCNWAIEPKFVLGIARDCNENNLYKEIETIHFVAFLSTKTNQPTLIRIINPAFKINDFEFNVYPTTY